MKFTPRAARATAIAVVALAGAGAASAAGVYGSGGSSTTSTAPTKASYAADLAAAINQRAGTSISADDVRGAFQDLFKQRLEGDVAQGRLTQAEADAILKSAQNGPGPGPGLGPHLFGPGRYEPGHNGPGLRGDRHAVETAVAKLLKLSETDLHTKLDTGKSLADVAQAQGVSRADLIQTITTALKASPGPGPQPSAAELADMAALIADHVHHKRP